MRIRDTLHEVLYDSPFALAAGQHFAVEWRVEPRVLRKVKASRTAQKFECERIFDEFWCLGIAPNGIDADRELEADVDVDAQVCVYLQLCCIPRGARSVSVGCRIKCRELCFESKYAEQRLGVVGDCEAEGASSKMLFTDKALNQVKTADLAHITIACEVTILSVQASTRGLDSDQRASRHSREESMSELE